MNRKHLASAFAVLLIGWSVQALAADHGWIKSIGSPHASEGLFEVQIESVDGQVVTTGGNHRIDAGEHTISISLVFNPEWGENMRFTEGQIYTKDIKLDIEAGKTYVLGAKVDLHATEEAQRDGSFWDPVMVQVE